MTPEQILMIFGALVNAAPKVLELYQKAISGTPITAADVQKELEAYGVDRAVLQNLILAKEAAGK